MWANSEQKFLQWRVRLTVSKSESFTKGSQIRHASSSSTSTHAAQTLDSGEKSNEIKSRFGEDAVCSCQQSKSKHGSNRDPDHQRYQSTSKHCSIQNTDRPRDQSTSRPCSNPDTDHQRSDRDQSTSRPCSNPDTEYTRGLTGISPARSRPWFQPRPRTCKGISLQAV